MSFSDFDRGFTAKDLRELRNAGDQHTRLELEWVYFRETEHVLSILRKVQPVEYKNDRAAFDAWRSHLNTGDEHTEDLFSESLD